MSSAPPSHPASSATGLRVRGCGRQRARVGTGTEVREERGDPIGGQKVKKMLCASVTQKKGYLASSGASLVCICACRGGGLCLGQCCGQWGLCDAGHCGIGLFGEIQEAVTSLGGW